MDPDNEGAYLAEGVVCHACKAKEGEAEGFRQAGNAAGMYYTLEYLRR